MKCELGISNRIYHPATKSTNGGIKFERDNVCCRYSSTLCFTFSDSLVSRISQMANMATALKAILAIYHYLDIVLSGPCTECFTPCVGLEHLDNFKTRSFLCWNSSFSYWFTFGVMGIRNAWYQKHLRNKKRIRHYWPISVHTQSSISG